MVPFLLAWQFLSIIPVKVKKTSDQDLAQSLVYFPVAGLLLGLILAGLKIILGALGMNPLSLVMVLVVALIALTGGIHLDGLADTLDAFLSRKNKEEMLAIMRDSHAGVMGILGIVSAVLLKIALFFSLQNSLLPMALIISCLLSRWALVYAIFLFPYARKEGKAGVYFSGITRKIFTLCTIITLACLLILAGFKGLIILIVCAAGIYLFGRFSCKKIGGLTGDVLGAINEIAEIAVLFSLFILRSHG